jgi:hypothetical protein
MVMIIRMLNPQNKGTIKEGNMKNKQYARKVSKPPIMPDGITIVVEVPDSRAFLFSRIAAKNIQEAEFT